MCVCVCACVRACVRVWWGQAWKLGRQERTPIKGWHVPGPEAEEAPVEVRESE